jgi:hypothetical protein
MRDDMGHMGKFLGGLKSSYNDQEGLATLSISLSALGFSLSSAGLHKTGLFIEAIAALMAGRGFAVYRREHKVALKEVDNLLQTMCG